MIRFLGEMVRPGDRLGERYEVIEQIAAGGMGTLWRAHHIQLDVDVALKVVTARASTPTSLMRFKREAQAAAKLRSPNIVQVLDYGEFEGQPFLAMELLRGEDLAARLARDGKLKLERCAWILDGVAKAIQLAHEAGIVHRDLKPGNIFLERVGEEEVVKVLDFGIAKDLSGAPDLVATTGGGIVGSPAYMSPEQVWGKKVGVRTDVWALGVVAFELLTGKNPFQDETLAKIFERIIRDPIPKLSAFEVGLPPALDEFFARALARSPTDRIASAKDFALQFRSASEERQSSRVDLRRRVLLPLGAAFALVAILAFLASAHRTAPSETRLEARDAGTNDARATVPALTQPKPSGPEVQVTSQATAPELPPRPTVAASSASSPATAKREAKSRGLSSAKSASPATPRLDPTFGIPVDR